MVETDIGPTAATSVTAQTLVGPATQLQAETAALPPTVRYSGHDLAHQVTGDPVLHAAGVRLILPVSDRMLECLWGLSCLHTNSGRKTRVKTIEDRKGVGASGSSPNAVGN
jgi:hypothetical protein